MITQLDIHNPWSREVVTGNAQFIEIGSTIYIVSQVRADNTFAVFKSNPTPPTPGPGFSFEAIAVYSFPEPNTSFDPVMAYDGSRYIYIVGTQSDGINTDVLLFVYDTNGELNSPPNPLGAPVTLVTASYVRDSYDVCIFGSNQFIGVSVTNPVEVWDTPTVSDVTALSISGGVVTVEAENSFETPQVITFTGLQVATQLNSVSATVQTSTANSFTANNFVATEGWQIPTSGSYTITVNNFNTFLSDSKVIYAASSAPLTMVSSLSGVAGEYTVVDGVYSFNPQDAAAKIFISYSFTPANYTAPSGLYESGFATWLPGHSLLGFVMNGATFVSVTLLDSSPFRTGNTFGAVSAYSPDGVSLEVYYESHPKQITFADQYFNLNLATYSSSTWNLPATVLTTFTGRYADTRLTVIPNGTARTLLQQYYSQLVQQNALVGNLLLGYSPTPGTWSFFIQPGTRTASYIQGTPSVSAAGTFVSYIAEPVYSARGAWSPQVKFYSLGDRLSYNTTPGVDSDWADYTPLQTVNYAYQGVWAFNNSYNTGDVVLVGAVYYTAKTTQPTSTTSPPLDAVNWKLTPTPDVDTTNFELVPTSWPLHANSLTITTTDGVSTFNLTDVPGFYNNYSFTWLRGTKTVLDSQTKWGVVGEQELTGAETAVYYTSDFDVPPVVVLVPDGGLPDGRIALRGTPFPLDASGTNDGSLDPITFTWSMNSSNAHIHLTPSASGTTATLLIDRAIGGASFTAGSPPVPNPLLVGVVATTTLHQPMTITNIAVASGVATISTSANVSLAAAEPVFLYDIGTATFLTDRVGYVQSSASGDVFSLTFADGLPTPNYASTPDTGSAIANQQFDFVAVNVAFNPGPTIDFTHDRLTDDPVTLPIQVDRNTNITINPTYTGVNDPDDATTYTWVQTSGTPIPGVQVLSGTTSASLKFNTSGLLIQGDTIVWSLTVNDGVNPPVTASVTVSVVSYPFDYPDTLRLTRAIWGSPPQPISQRNTVQPWSNLDASAIYTNFQSVKRTSVGDGTDRYILISSGSVCIYGGINPTLLLLRKLFPPADNTLSPPFSNPIADAVHTEDDWTLVLDSAGNLYRYSTAPLINTDNPDTTIVLPNITSMSFNKIFTTVSYNNSRVVILTGSNGCLLLQLRNNDLHIEGFIELSTESGLLYGVSNVQFVRASNVESLNTGKLLLGTVVQVVANITSVGVSANAVTVVADNTFEEGDVISFSDLFHAAFLNGITTSVVSATDDQFIVSLETANYTVTAETTGTATGKSTTYETLIDLSRGQIVGTWDASKLVNQFVTTGEILFEPNDTYAGQPIAPVLIPIIAGTPSGGYVSLTVSWTIERSDLVQSYTVQSSSDPLFGIYTTTVVNSGFVQTVSIPKPVGQVFYFRVNASSPDGISPFSNVQTFNT